MTDPKPSVGRLVHYVSRGSADGVFPAVCRAAVVTEAPSPLPTSPSDLEPVGLCVLNPEGLFLNRHVQHDEQRSPGTWHWPERVP